MTLEEAQKILKKEGYDIEKVGRPCSPSIVLTEYESPEICEAMQVVCSAGYGISMVSSLFNERKARLSLDLSENTKAPGPGEEQPKDNDLKAATDAFVVQANEIMRLKKENAELLEAIDKMKEGNPAIKESASQFNDALLDEQAKKIERLKKENAELLGIVGRMKQDVKEVDYNCNAACKENERLNEKIRELTKEKSNLEDQITVLNACKKHNDKIDRKQIKYLGKEIAKLNGIIHDKNAILADVAEELRLTKIREKNLAELGLKYVGENEKLKKELADKVVDKIDAQALKSAESALAWKEKVIARKDMALAYDEKKIAEKDEEIADLGNELEATKKELEAFKESYKRRIKEDSEHFEHIQKICNAGLQKWLIESEYLEKDKPFRFPQLPDFSEEEKKKVSSAKDTHPTEDNPEEIAIEKAVKLVRKAMKEGHTVTIKYEN